MNFDAKAVLDQLGGRAFIVMTGARNFVVGGSTLSFRLPGAGGFCKKGINVVSVTLKPNDTYSVQFAKLRAGERKIISQHEDVYCDQLAEIFRNETGLETRMPKFVKEGA